MFNDRVENLKGLLELLRHEGFQVIGEVDEYGSFGWIVDPEESKIGLREPVHSKLKPE